MQVSYPFFVSGYGYCSLNNSGSRYKNSVTLSDAGFKKAKHNLRNQKNVKAYAVNIAPNVWKLYTSRCSLMQEPQPLASHGATILAISKIILMGGIEFVLRHFRPDKAQLLYLDTDSLHIALNEPIFEENVAKHMKQSFDQKRYHFFDEESAPSGMLVTESIVDYERIFAEKFYVLKMKSATTPGEYVFDDSFKSLACKGIPHRILNNHRSKIDSLDPSHAYQESAICRLAPNLGVSNSVRYKTLGALMIPSRRFFFNQENSIPFTFPDCDKERPIEQTKDCRHYLYKRLNNKKGKRRAIHEDAAQNDQLITHLKLKKNKRKNYESAEVIPNEKIKKVNKSGCLTQLMQKAISSSDIIDTAHKSAIANSSFVDDVIWSPPKKRKRNVFIDCEAKC